MNVFEAVWTTWLLVWLAVAFWSKRTARQEGALSWGVHMIPLMVGGMLLMNDHWSWPFLQAPVVPWSPAFYWVGLLLTVGGMLFTVWARLYLGSNWSASVQVKTGHELVRSGPYRWVRHPIYTGLLAAFLGTGLAIDAWRGVVAFVIVMAGFWYKLRLEERWMIDTFGDAYRDYQKHTKALIPGLL